VCVDEIIQILAITVI